MKPVIVAVGMATLGEIEAVANLYRQAGNTDLIFLHCVSNYPCTDESLNLLAMTTLRQAFQLPVGYSDHSVGAEAATLSIALGARVIEKHFTLDRNLPGPDHRASSTPDEFAALVRSVRRAEAMLGSPVKQCQDEERQMALVSRKSLHMARPMRAGETLTLGHLTMKRPGDGLAATEIARIVGKTAVRDFEKGYQLKLLDLC